MDQISISDFKFVIKFDPKTHQSVFICLVWKQFGIEFEIGHFKGSVQFVSLCIGSIVTLILLIIPIWMIAFIYNNVNKISLQYFSMCTFSSFPNSFTSQYIIIYLHDKLAVFSHHVEREYKSSISTYLTFSLNSPTISCWESLFGLVSL